MLTPCSQGSPRGERAAARVIGSSLFTVNSLPNLGSELARTLFEQVGDVCGTELLESADTSPQNAKGQERAPAL